MKKLLFLFLALVSCQLASAQFSAAKALRIISKHGDLIQKNHRSYWDEDSRNEAYEALSSKLINKWYYDDLNSSGSETLEIKADGTFIIIDKKMVSEGNLNYILNEPLTREVRGSWKKQGDKLLLSRKTGRYYYPEIEKLPLRIQNEVKAVINKINNFPPKLTTLIIYRLDNTELILSKTDKFYSENYLKDIYYAGLSLLAEDELNSNRTNDALKAIDEAILYNSNDAKNYKIKGDIYLKMNELDKAEDMYQKAASMNPASFENGDYKLYIANEFFNKYKENNELMYLDMAIKYKPQDNYYEEKGMILINRANSQINRNNNDEALKDCNDIANLPLKKEMKEKIASKITEFVNGFANKEDYSTAIKFINSVISLCPDVADLYYAKGMCFCLLDKKEDAKEVWNKLISIDPSYSQKETDLYKILFVPVEIDIESVLGEYETQVANLVQTTKAGKSLSKAKMEKIGVMSEQLTKAAYGMNKGQMSRFQLAYVEFQNGVNMNSSIKEKKKTRNGNLLKGIASGILGF